MFHTISHTKKPGDDSRSGDFRQLIFHFSRNDSESRTANRAAKG